jgi:hypothetical protein
VKAKFINFKRDYSTYVPSKALRGFGDKLKSVGFNGLNQKEGKYCTLLDCTVNMFVLAGIFSAWWSTAPPDPTLRQGFINFSFYFLFSCDKQEVMPPYFRCFAPETNK